MTSIVCLVRDQRSQARIQAEMDLVVGKDRLPTFADRERLPYLHAVITEAIRFASTTPVGVPHRLMEDDEYEGMFLPKGAMVMANTWAMLNDPRVYPEPEKFDPSRVCCQEIRPALTGSVKAEQYLASSLFADIRAL